MYTIQIFARRPHSFVLPTLFESARVRPTSTLCLTKELLQNTYLMIYSSLSPPFCLHRRGYLREQVFNQISVINIEYISYKLINVKCIFIPIFSSEEFKFRQNFIWILSQFVILVGWKRNIPKILQSGSK